MFLIDSQEVMLEIDIVRSYFIVLIDFPRVLAILLAIFTSGNESTQPLLQVSVKEIQLPSFPFKTTWPNQLRVNTSAGFPAVATCRRTLGRAGWDEQVDQDLPDNFQ